MASPTSHHWPVVGHQWAVEHLARALRHERVRHAYLLTGPDQIGKTTLARAFAAALNCTSDQPPCGDCRACRLIAKDAHPDVTFVAAEETDGALKIDQIRELQQALALRPYEARYRVALLRGFHAATPQAQDALLKTLEEPAPDVVLLLTARSLEPLLPTIVSRCQPLHLRPLPIELVRDTLEWQRGVPQDEAETLARLSGGRIGWAIRAGQDASELERRNQALATLESALLGNRRERFALVEALSKEKIALRTMLDVWQGYWRDVLLLACGSRTPITNYDLENNLTDLAKLVGRDVAQAALAATRRSLELLGKNANTRLVLEVLMLNYPTV